MSDTTATLPLSNGHWHVYLRDVIGAPGRDFGICYLDLGAARQAKQSYAQDLRVQADRYYIRKVPLHK